METLDDVFAAMPDAPTVGTHELLIIDPDTRQIDVPDAEAIFGVENDCQAERKYFQCPRYVGDSLDLAACSLRVTFTNANEETDAYSVDDLAVSGDVVLFSWELSRKVTRYKGAVRFLVYAGAEDGTDWHTTLANGNVLEGKEVDASQVEEKTSDVITQLLLMVAKQTDAVEAEGAAQIGAVQEAAAVATAEAQAAIDAKGAATLATIPEDYTAMGNQVDKLTRSTAGAIVCVAEGETIQVHDSSDHYLQGLRIFGRSTQDATPTPDAPVEIVSTPAPVVRIYGKNLMLCQDVHIESEPYFYHTIYTDFEPIIGEMYTLSMDIICDVLPFHINIGCGYKSYNSDMSPKISAVYSDNGRISISFEWNLTPEQVAAGYTKLAFRVPRFASETAFTATISNIMLERGENASSFEPYKTAQAVAITTPTGLPGIPVESSGNYTDANGQQWICDEVDLGRGVYVQRVYSYTVTGDETMYDNHLAEVGEAGNIRAEINGLDLPCPFSGDNRNFGMATHYNYRVTNKTPASCWVNKHASGNGRLRFVDTLERFPTLTEFIEFAKLQYADGTPITVVYLMETPVESALSDAEILAFKAMHSNKPTTTLLNDSGAHMAVEYVADTKLYIDQKLAELAGATTT